MACHSPLRFGITMNRRELPCFTNLTARETPAHKPFSLNGTRTAAIIPREATSSWRPVRRLARLTTTLWGDEGRFDEDNGAAIPSSKRTSNPPVREIERERSLPSDGELPISPLRCAHWNVPFPAHFP